ncbi:unnamed protein product, partial [Notodromas monacha]
RFANLRFLQVSLNDISFREKGIVEETMTMYNPYTSEAVFQGSLSSAGDVETGQDLVAGASFFNSDFKKNEDLKIMLDNSKDSLKLEAMKRIIAMVAKGRDASDLFPAVVKNVVSKNVEVKKLVYVYLVRYAEEQQDLALLSISTFQRALKDPNQLIRASALRVLSSIRVPVIIPIVMLAIKEAANDMSAYVRKTAAHAIPKLYSLDPEQKEELVSVIEKLLSDKATLVLGSAVMAFEEVCPERIDLIHKNYRKFCTLITDVEEWGQVIILNMLVRYARTQFEDPNHPDFGGQNESRSFYEDSESDSSDPEEVQKKIRKPKTKEVDPDLTLLLRNCRPLLQSRNAAVVMAVAQLYHHCGPRSEMVSVSRALVRLLRSHREVQALILNTLAALSTERKELFEPYLKNFFVHANDPTLVKMLKLEVMTNVANSGNISVILREFQTYISSPNKEFVTATIQAIGRCASNIKEVTDSCLHGLVILLSNRDESVVAESVVVIRKLLQLQPSHVKDIVVQLAKLVDTITVPNATASILWLLGEYSEQVPLIAPDVLRKMAKQFPDLDNGVKLQTMNLAVKLLLTNPSQTALLAQYVLNMAKYDISYDIRDRARFLRAFVFPEPGTEGNPFVKQARKIFLAAKPAPLLESRFKARENYRMGSLSHYLNAPAEGYHELPPFSEKPTDSTLRAVKLSEPEPKINAFLSSSKTKKSGTKKEKIEPSFYSDVEAEEDEEESDEETDTSTDESSDGSSSGEDTDESSSSKASETREPVKQKPVKSVAVKPAKAPVLIDTKATANESSSESETSDSESESVSESSEEEIVVKTKPKQKEEPKIVKRDPEIKKTSQKNVDLLLDLDSFDPIGPTLAPVTFSAPLEAMKPSSTNFAADADIQLASSAWVQEDFSVLVDYKTAAGLEVALRYRRVPSIYSPKMIAMELRLENKSEAEMTDVKVELSNSAPKGVTWHGFPTLHSVATGMAHTAGVGLDTGDTTQPVALDICISGRKFPATLKVPVGEMCRAVTMGEGAFAKERAKLRGMNEHTAKFTLKDHLNDPGSIAKAVYSVANVLQIPSFEVSNLRFAGQTLSSNVLVLVSVVPVAGSAAREANLTVNCDKMVIGSILLKEIKDALSK